MEIKIKSIENKFLNFEFQALTLEKAEKGLHIWSFKKDMNRFIFKGKITNLKKMEHISNTTGQTISSYFIILDNNETNLYEIPSETIFIGPSLEEDKNNIILLSRHIFWKEK